MAKSFNILKKKLSAPAQKQAKQLTEAIIAELPLQELRQAKKQSQSQLAAVLHVKQANISRIEKRTDMYLSTLRNYIEAMGGALDIIARFPDGQIRIKQFQQI